MNRLLGALLRSGKPRVAFSPGIPLAPRGAGEVTSYASSALPQTNDDLMLRVEQLYARDAQLHALWSSALEARSMAVAAWPVGQPAGCGRTGRTAADSWRAATGRASR